MVFVTSKLTHQQEDALSYLVGLAPINEDFSLPKEVLADLEIQYMTTLGARIKGLIAKGAVLKVLTGSRGHKAVYRVLKRPEDFQRVRILETRLC